MFNFPSSPSIGQIYPPYTWDGEKWTVAFAPISIGDPPSDTNPLMNGAVSFGVAVSYARGDHVHPSDTSKAVPSNETLTGTTTGPDASVGGTTAVSTIVSTTANNNRFGTASGSAAVKADANILFYDFGGDNWAGMGVDSGGNFWIRTGLSGSPGAALFIDPARNATFLKSPEVPTPATSENSTKVATTAFVLANPASGAFLPLTGGTVTGALNVYNGDIYAYRAGGTTGVIYLSSSDRYLYFDGSNYYFNGAYLNSSAGRIWGTNDFGTPMVNHRFVYGADYNHAIDSGLAEPYVGYVQTGTSGYNYAGLSAQVRYRQFQIQLGGSWYAVGTV